MRRFPDEFADMLRRPLKMPAGSSGQRTLKEKQDHLAWFPLPLKPAAADAGIALLDRHITPFLRPCRGPVPAESITGMKRNYSEVLAKTLSNSSVMLDGKRTAAAQKAAAIGLTTMLSSQSLRECAERVSGFHLLPEPGMQAIRYLESDYVGPHNDHHPEQAHLRDGYVDLQITLTHDSVDSQFLIYERAGYFNRAVDVSIQSGISISLLPFWHQVTPLIARKGREKHARRWLLLASFIIDRS